MIFFFDTTMKIALKHDSILRIYYLGPDQYKKKCYASTTISKITL